MSSQNRRFNIEQQFQLLSGEKKTLKWERTRARILLKRGWIRHVCLPSRHLHFLAVRLDLDDPERWKPALMVLAIQFLFGCIIVDFFSSFVSHMSRVFKTSRFCRTSIKERKGIWKMVSFFLSFFFTLSHSKGVGVWFYIFFPSTLSAKKGKGRKSGHHPPGEKKRKKKSWKASWMYKFYCY